LGWHAGIKANNVFYEDLRKVLSQEEADKVIAEMNK
jgi:hypothetical protein